MKLATWFFAFATFLMMLFPFMAKAGQENNREEVELGEVKVTAEREVVSPRRVTVTEEEIEENNPLDTGDMLKKVPGISVKRTGLFGLDPVLRGFREDQVNLLIDGTKVWGACPGRMDPPSSQIEVDAIEEIEIIRGPFSVRHGAGTLGGVINLKTKQPKRYEKAELHGSASVGYDGVAEGKKGNFNVFGGDKLYDYRFRVGFRDYEDYESPGGNVENSSFEDQEYSAKIGLNPAKHHRLDLGASLTLGEDIHFPARSMDTKEHQSLLSNIQYSIREISPWFTSFTVRAYYNPVEHKMNNDDRSTASTMPMETESESDTYGGRLETSFELGHDSSLVTGIDFYHLQRDADRVKKMIMGMMSTRTEDKPWNNARIQDWGFYSELESELTPQLELTLGARLDLVYADSAFPSSDFPEIVGKDELEESEVNASGHIGLAYSLTENIDLMAAIGRGVRTADVNERYSFFFPSSRYFDNFDYLGNPELDPEESLEFDLGAELDFDRVSLGISLFYSRIEDYITGETDPSLAPRTSGASGVKRYVNVDAELMGLELDSQLKITEEIILKGDLSYLIGKNTDSNTDLPQIPPLEVNLALRYNTAFKGIWGEASTRFVTMQDKIDSDFGENKTPAFSTFDIALGATPLYNCTLIAGVENIFDRRYSEHLNGTDTSTGEKLLEPGRNIFAKLKWEF
jgi:iron complex outermembrane receptor protein